MMYMKEIKKIIKANITDAMLGIFFNRNSVGDVTSTIYKNGEVQVDICHEWDYFEVFGLTEEEQEEIDNYYQKLIEGIRK